MWPIRRLARLPRLCRLARLSRLLGLSVTFLVVLQGCQDVVVRNGTSSGTNTPKPSVGGQCAVSPRVAPDGALQGATKSGELWAIGGVPHVGEEYKIVIRETGSGDLSIRALDPNGSRLDPSDVAEHSSSNFDRPGDEWGVFFKFDRAGCWIIDAKRVGAEGRITVLVKK